MATRKLQVEILGDASSLQRAFGQASKSGSGFGRTLTSLGKVAAVGVGAAFAGLAATLKVGFDELAEGQRVSAQTGAVLKSTGGIANVTAKHVNELAQAQSHLTGIDDELIQTGENLLLTFKNVRNEVGEGANVFDRATKSALDLSTAGFGSVESASKMLGKSLNDPVKGMTALGRAGVTFSEDQKKAITEMVKTNDLLGAQKLILKEVESQVGGSAKAFGETLPGQLAKLKNSFEEVAASVAETLLPYLTDLLSWTNQNMPTIQRVIQSSLDAVVVVIRDVLVPVITTLIGWFQRVAEVAEKAWPRVQAAAETVMKWYRDNLEPTMTSVSRNISRAWDSMGSDMQTSTKSRISSLPPLIKAQMENLGSVVNVALALLRGDWAEAWLELKEIPVRTFKALVQTVKIMASTFLAAAKAIGAAILRGIGDGLQNLGPWMREKLQAIPAAIAAIAGQVPGLAAAIGRAIVSGILSGLAGLASSVGSKIIGSVQSGIDRAMGVFGHSPQEVIGFALVEGILRGWESRAGKLKESMQTRITEAVDAARTAIGNAQAGFASAFGDLMSNALSAFDAKASLIETRTEKLLRLMDEATRKADLKGAISQAQKDLQAAQAAFATVTPQAGEDEAAFNQRIGEALAKTMAAQKTLDDALAAQQRFRLDQQAIKERKALDDRLALRRRHFEDDLLGLQNYANNHALSAEQLNQRLIAIFGKYRVPFKKAAIELGSALAEGLREAAIEVGNQAAAVRNEIMKHLSNIQVRINVDVVVPDKPDRRQHGGPVKRRHPYVVGEAGPELFIPNSSGRIMANGSGSMAQAGGLTWTGDIHVHGSVMTEGQLTETVRRGLYNVGRRNPGWGM